MTDRPPFEARLEERLRARAALATRPFDAAAIARQAVAVDGRRRIGWLDWFPTRRPNVGWLVVALLLALALLGAVAGTGALLREGPAVVTNRWIVFVRDGDLFVAAGDGSGQTLIASGGADAVKLGYLTAAWSPDMRHIAAVRDVGGAFLTPGVDLLTADGTLVRTVALDPGCGPSLTWSPDSTEVAIATCPADVPRDAIEPVKSGIRLLLAGLDASADREIALPPEWQSVASANPEVWIRPDLWARWSPDGRWIALWAIVAEQGGRYLVAADGSGTRRIEELSRDVYRVDSFDWSHDGRSLAISGNLVGCVQDVCLGIVDPEGGLVTSTVGHPSDGNPDLHGKLFWPEYSPGGDRVAVLGGLLDFTTEPQVAETTTLYAYDVATARFTELTSGTRALVLDATGAAQPTGAVTGELVAGGTVAWTPDGRSLLYLTREGGDSAASWTIHSIDAAGGSQSSVLVRGVQSFDIGWPGP